MKIFFIAAYFSLSLLFVTFSSCSKWPETGRIKSVKVILDKTNHFVVSAIVYVPGYPLLTTTFINEKAATVILSAEKIGMLDSLQAEVYCPEYYGDNIELGMVYIPK